MELAANQDAVRAGGSHGTRVVVGHLLVWQRRPPSEVLGAPPLDFLGDPPSELTVLRLESLSELR